MAHVKSVLNRDGQRAVAAIHGSLGLKFNPANKANETIWKTSSRQMTCATKTMNGGWRLEFKLCSNLLKITP
jgi:hypothetical protein